MTTTEAVGMACHSETSWTDRIEVADDLDENEGIPAQINVETKTSLEQHLGRHVFLLI
jgi:hypothetical protein